jgi:hypothetical protein
MPPWLREIPTWICDEHGCTYKATRELVNSANATVGRYCRTHAERRLAAMRAAEAPRSGRDP